MPFTCDGCNQKCFYVPEVIEQCRFCTACAKRSMEIFQQWAKDAEDEYRNIKEAQVRLFPVPVRPPTLPEICLLVRDYQQKKEDWPKELLEEILAMLEARLQFWGVRDYGGHGVEYQIIDACINQMVRATCDLIHSELCDRITASQAKPDAKPDATDIDKTGE